MTIFDDYDRYDAVGLAHLVREGATTAGELLESAIARLEAVDPVINAVTVKMFGEARAAIEAGLPDGPLRGVPFLLKDLFAPYADSVMTNGSRLYADYVCDHDSELVARYRRAGLVVFGRTNSPEMGIAYTTEPHLHGPTRNPWDLDRTPGGSSGGAAAAIAARVVPAAHASDGGGSIRVPASCCGLFGLKPTRGRTPAGPDAGEGWAGMSVGHAITLSVRDSAALLDACAGPDVGDPYWAPPPARAFADEVGADPGELRIAVSAETPTGAPVDPECIAAMERAATLCAELGHRVAEAAPTYDKESLADAFLKIVTVNTLNGVIESGRERGRDWVGEVENMTRAMAEMGAGVSGADYTAAVDTIHRVGRQVARFMLDYDVLLTPTMAKPPLPLGVLDMMSDDVDAYFAESGAFAGFPPLSNATGAPAMSVPLYWTQTGLPIGAQFVGRFGDEATLLRLAGQLEQAAPWAQRRPPLDI